LFSDKNKVLFSVAKVKLILSQPYRNLSTALQKSVHRFTEICPPLTEICPPLTEICPPLLFLSLTHYAFAIPLKLLKLLKVIKGFLNVKKSEKGAKLQNSAFKKWLLFL